MDTRTKVGRGCIGLALALGLLWALPVHAGDGGRSALDLTKDFLQKYPKFRAEGVMTSTLPDRPPYRCRVQLRFDKATGMLFSYNTDGAKNIIPYDFHYEDRQLRETVYNRERTETLKDETLGAPTRTIFNFVWDLLHEAEHGMGLNSLLFSGLMSINLEEAGKASKVTLKRRLPGIPVDKVLFTFDSDERLRRIEIESGGSIHRIEIRRFRPDAPPPDDDPPKN